MVYEYNLHQSTYVLNQSIDCLNFYTSNKPQNTRIGIDFKVKERDQPQTYLNMSFFLVPNFLKNHKKKQVVSKQSASFHYGTQMN